MSTPAREKDHKLRVVTPPTGLVWSDIPRYRGTSGRVLDTFQSNDSDDSSDLPYTFKLLFEKNPDLVRIEPRDGTSVREPHIVRFMVRWQLLGGCRGRYVFYIFSLQAYAYRSKAKLGQLQPRMQELDTKICEKRRELSLARIRFPSISQKREFSSSSRA